MKRFCILLLAVAFAVMPLAVSVSANSPPEAELGIVVFSVWEIVLIVLILVVSILIGLAKTLIPEWLVALLFCFDKEERRLVLLTNLVSQGAMWVATILIFLIGGVPIATFFMEYYVGCLIVLEAIIYICEFLWYRKKLVWYSWMRCLAFSVVANSASLALGLIPFLDLF